MANNVNKNLFANFCFFLCFKYVVVGMTFDSRDRNFDHHSISYVSVVQLLHSCGPLFKIIRVCGPQSAKNSYFRSKIRCSLKKKKKKVFTWNRSPKFLFWRKIIAFSKKKLRLLLLIDKTCAKLICGMRPASP